MRLLFVVLTLLAPLRAAEVPRWGRFETELRASAVPADPLAVEVLAEFRGPSGTARTVPAFWDGGSMYRVRFTPDQLGRWTWSTRAREDGLTRRGEFTCTAPRGTGAFDLHGPVVLSPDHRRFAHADGTPFFYLADTAWNGPLLASDQDWQHYLDRRATQGFTAVQWVATQWRGSPTGDAHGRLAYSGADPIRLNLDLIRGLERRHDRLRRAGLLSVPVMLWSISSPPGSEINPGVSLSEADAIRLARYLLARWGADPVVWLLNGDGDYRGPRAERWKRIGRGTFAQVAHAPVSLHPGGLLWVMDEFRDESWLDIAGYQSGHADSDRNSAWIHSGPPAREWKRQPVRPVISLEAPYDRQDPAARLAPDFLVRRNHLWSLLNAPVAGITYGVHGIWGWSDGVHPAPGHGTTVWPHWKALLDLPGAGQVAMLRRLLEGLDWTHLEPAPALVAVQPGTARPAAFISAAQTPSRSVTLVYTPEAADVVLLRAALPADAQAEWIQAATGSRTPARGSADGTRIVFTPPGPGDWLVQFRQ